MYVAIVLLPLLGAVIAGIIALVGARNRFPGEEPPPPLDDHAAAPASEAEHAAFANTHVEQPQHAPSAGGNLPPHLPPSPFLLTSSLRSFFASSPSHLAPP